MRAPAIALVGSTASGKSALAVALAAELGDVEIVSVDSMAVYRRMDIATAKPSPSDRAAVPHHLLDLLEPWEECTVSLFKSAASRALEEIGEQGHLALLVGGSGLYHRAVIDNLEIPGRFPEVRRSLEASLGDAPAMARLFAHLEELDPVAADRIEPGNDRRIIRALEVTLGAGRPFSSFGPGLETYPPTGIRQVGIAIDQTVIDDAIEARVDAWLVGGLLEEVADLHAAPRGLSITARQAIGYLEVSSCLDGSCSLDDARAAIIKRTKSLSRRQRSWFRRDPRVCWVQPTEVGEVLRAHLADLRGGLEMSD